MDYSHFWWREKEIAARTFEKIVKDFSKLLDEFKAVGVELNAGVGNESPVFNAIEVRFNDASDNRQPKPELFHFPRVMGIKRERKPDSSGKYFESCKTLFKPYNLAVTAFLLIAKHYLKEAIEIKSDGGNDDWFDAKLLCHVKLGYGYELMIVDGVLKEVEKE